MLGVTASPAMQQLLEIIMKQALSAFLLALSLSPATLLAQGATYGSNGDIYIHTPGATYGPNGQIWIHSD